MAWLGTYAYRRKITIDNTNIDSDLTHFPVPVVLGISVGQSSQDVSDIFDEVGAGYLKIAITKSDGTTQIYGDVEQWDSVNEKAVIYVAKSDLAITAAAVTELYIYYDSTQVDNTTYIGLSGDTAAQSVWDIGFVGVYHMNQDPSGGAGCILDSTSNNNNGTPSGMVSGDLVDSGIGKALDFDGSDDAISIGTSASLQTINDPNNYTIEFSIKTGSAGDDSIFIPGILEKRELAALGDRVFVFSIDAAGKATFGTRDSIVQTWQKATGTTTVNDNSWHYISGRKAGTAYDIFVAGIYEDQLVNSETLTSNDGITIGSRRLDAGNLSSFYTGGIGFLRVSNTDRSADWIKATNYALTDDLVVFGTVEGPVIVSPEINLATSIDSNLQINILTLELSIPIIPGPPNISINIASNEIIIPAAVSSNISINITAAEAISEIVIPEPSLFVGLFIESPEVTIPATAGSNVSIIIIPQEATIPVVATSNISINITATEATIPIDASGSTVSIFSMASTVLRYLLTITGAADGTTDFTLPMSSFQARRKSGDPTYLSVVTPSLDYASEIAARSNGTIKVEQAYVLDGEYVQRELILESEINDIKSYEGGRNKSIVLDGYKTTTHTPKAITLTTATYKAILGGKIRYRVAEPNVFLNPGDTVTIGTDTFVLGVMSYAISPTMQQIELEEA